MLSEEIIENAEWKTETVAEEKEFDNKEWRKSSCSVEHMLCTVASHTGKWDGAMFDPPAMHTSICAVASVRGWSGWSRKFRTQSND